MTCLFAPGFPARAFARGFAFLIVLSLCAEVAFAQRIPGTIRPGQIERQFEGRKSPQAVEPAQKGRRDMPLPDAPPGAEEIRLLVNDISLEGATVYTAAELRDLYEQQLGQEL